MEHFLTRRLHHAGPNGSQFLMGEVIWAQTFHLAPASSEEEQDLDLHGALSVGYLF